VADGISICHKLYLLDLGVEFDYILVAISGNQWQWAYRSGGKKFVAGIKFFIQQRTSDIFSNISSKSTHLFSSAMPSITKLFYSQENHVSGITCARFPKKNL
jgi:hypothetical protein